MRLTASMNIHERGEIEDFADLILKIGDGRINEPNDGEVDIEIPEDLLITDTENPLASLIEFVYPNIVVNLHAPGYFEHKVILAPRHELVDIVNDTILGMIGGDTRKYLSSDSICPSDVGASTIIELFTPDVLNNINASGIPKHRIVLKKDVLIMLLRNIDQAAGLCNGTRLQVVRLYNHVIEAKVLSGTNVGQVTYIPRMRLTPTDKRIPFKFQRRQFPIAVCFVMTINKSQGQSLEKVGLFLCKPVFSHGQLYVAVSKVKSRSGLKMLYDNDDRVTNKTKNVVYKEVLQDL